MEKRIFLYGYQIKSHKKCSSAENFESEARKIRKQNGISIERLFFISDANKNYISDLERGNRNPTIILLDRLAFSLEIEVKKFFEE